MGRSIPKTKRFIILTALLALCIAAGLCLGSIMTTDSLIIIGLRLPRVLAAMLAGAELSVSGLLLQTISGNGLCAPNIIGVNAGGGFGVMLLSCIAPSLWRLLPFSAFLGALICALLVIKIAKSASGEISKYTLILSGIAVGAFFSAATSFLILRFPESASSYSSFSLGGFSGITISKLSIPFIITLICIAISLILAAKIKLLLLGDDIASSIGVNVGKTRTVCLILSAALAGCAVSFAGLLGFIGLAVPHICRKFFGQDVKTNIIACIEIGAILTIIADLLGRVLFAPSELPAGVITAVLGAPFLIYLITAEKKR